MNFILLPPADTELEEAIEYYNDQLQGLGDQFYQQFLTTLNYLTQVPDAWRKIGKNTRRINIKRFPYLVLYVVENQDILITCIAHQHRKPTYYLDR